VKKGKESSRNQPEGGRKGTGTLTNQFKQTAERGMRGGKGERGKKWLRCGGAEGF